MLGIIRGGGEGIGNLGNGEGIGGECESAGSGDLSKLICKLPKLRGRNYHNGISFWSESFFNVPITETV